MQKMMLDVRGFFRDLVLSKIEIYKIYSSISSSFSLYSGIIVMMNFFRELETCRIISHNVKRCLN